MKFRDYDLCLITDEKQRLYFTGFHSSAGYLMFNKTRKTFVVDNRYFYAAKKKLTSRGYEVICGSDYTALVKAVENFKVSVLGIDFASTNLNQFATLKKLLPTVSFKDIGAEIADEMSVKCEPELKAIDKACQIAEKSFKQVFPLFHRRK